MLGTGEFNAAGVVATMENLSEADEFFHLLFYIIVPSIYCLGFNLLALLPRPPGWVNIPKMYLVSAICGVIVAAAVWALGISSDNFGWFQVLKLVLLIMGFSGFYSLGTYAWVRYLGKQARPFG